jgi:hypothetical protein
MPELLTQRGLEKYLGVGRKKAAEIAHTPNAGFKIKIGHRYYFYRPKLDEWLASRAK